MQLITGIEAREVLDSRGKPTVEVEVRCDGGAWGRAIVPAGASTGRAEACELRDGGPRYDGDGVQRAVANVNQKLAPRLLGGDPSDQQGVDLALIKLDGTSRKERLGGNALLGVSLAVAHAGAAASGVPLYVHLHRLLNKGTSASGVPGAGMPAVRMPLPMTNMISGGLHAGGNLDFQDVLIIPGGAGEYPMQLEWLVRVYRRLGRLLDEHGYEGRLVADEGGFGPRLPHNRAAVEFVLRAVEAAGLRPGEDVTLALDVAATHFYRDGAYHLASENGVSLSSEQMIDRLVEWVDAFPISSIEDGLAEDDWAGWQQLTARLGGRVQLVGDDLFATNADRLRKGVEQQAANSVLIKVNQIGTLSETFETVQVARQAGYAMVVSARSGETEDTTLADLAVAVAAGQIKIGSIVRSERLAKYNQLLRIAEQLQERD